MAKVKIQGHASGTGVLTVTAPNTSTDRTITLPDATGTLATTADTFNPDAAVTINESGADVDFRVESDNDANALFVQGSDGNVGIGISTPTNPSIEYYITFTPPTLPTLQISDAQVSNTVALGSLALKSRDYFRFDINNDGRITISDTYSIFARRNGLINSFATSPPDSRIFTTTQWSTINANTSNLKLTIPGVQTITINTPVSGGVSSYYITRLGYSN